MVQSIDGVGTKTIIARKMKKYDTIGIDLLSAAANDILVMGAKPLTFLDYIANDRLDPDIIDEIVDGMVSACKETGVSLVGGETAEMPDTYLPGEHDLVGVITGVVDKKKIIDGSKIKDGDALIALPSNGLHTNGYSLARKLFFDIGKYDVRDEVQNLEKPVGLSLLEPHINYTNHMKLLIDNNVEIASGCTIDRGSVDDTKIGKNTYLDNQVHIAHNVKIGSNCMIAGQVGFAGSSTIGNNVSIGGQAGISGHLSIGNNVKIGGGSGVVKDIEDNQVVMGYPAVAFKDFIKNWKNK